MIDPQLVKIAARSTMPEPIPPEEMPVLPRPLRAARY
jgi:hypothetical protein